LVGLELLEFAPRFWMRGVPERVGEPQFTGPSTSPRTSLTEDSDYTP